MCGSKLRPPWREYKMSCAAFAKKILIHHCMPLLAMVLFCTCAFGQADSKPSQGSEGKKASTGKGKKQSAAAQEKKTEAEPAGAEKAGSAGEGDQEEVK